ncbi:hypothetical protein SUGI_0326690 [Cryptomeria japonica]|uniref:glucan endo-1,3-beta-glucosidase-like n=1 Tax=Cryptomeria japonica TaxID=3369 RepID=UPI002408E39B|nr:glucan endo-1,3-beta-glucosidase-like [Cryptomeria japonica]GLJ18439.1 hypothetical protein SUGI_0326690 [Cryptomeria japonica]
MAGYVPYLVHAINNIQITFENANLQNNINVSTAHSTIILGTSFPPSKGTFSDIVKDSMNFILQFLQDHGSPFMANVYPYFSYDNNKDSISLDFVLFKSRSPMVTDGDLSYTNLLDITFDTLLFAMETMAHANVPIVITESGWPSIGKDVATIGNA